MINDVVLAALDLERDANGKLDMLGYNDPRSSACVTSIQRIYAVNTREATQCSTYGATYDDDVNAVCIGVVYLPYHLKQPEPPTSRKGTKKRASLIIQNCVQYAIDFCHAHVQSGRTVFLTIPDCEHVDYYKSNQPGLVKASAHLPFNDHMYRFGLGGALELLNRVCPGRTVREGKEFLEQLSAALEMRDDLKFERDNSVVTLRDNTAFKCNRFATTEDDVWQMLPPVTPEDRIVWQSRLPIEFDPTITSHPLVDAALEGWSGPKGSDKWWRNLEANFGCILLPTVKYKGLIFNIAQGGAGMSTMNDLREALFGRDAIYQADLDDFETTFGRGYMAGARAVIVDDMPEGKISNKALGVVKSLVTGVPQTGKEKFNMEKLLVQGMAIIFNGNTFLKISQREAAKNSSRRRFIPVSHNKIFDDARIADASQRDADPELANRIAADPKALSYLFNLTMQAAARIVVRNGYTPVAEDLSILDTELAAQNVIDNFLEEIGGIFGEKCSDALFELEEPGFGKNKLIAPLRLLRASKPCRASIVNLETHQGFWSPDVNYRNIHLWNETTILYERYERYCDEVGEKAKLTGQSFRSELASRGYVDIRGPRNPWDPSKGQPHIIVPAGTGKKQSDLMDLVNSSLVDYVVTDDDPEPMPEQTPKLPIPTPKVSLDDCKIHDFSGMSDEEIEKELFV